MDDAELPKVTRTTDTVPLAPAAALGAMVKFLEAEIGKQDTFLSLPHLSDLYGVAESLATTEKDNERLMDLKDQIDPPAPPMTPSNPSSSQHVVFKEEEPSEGASDESDEPKIVKEESENEISEAEGAVPVKEEESVDEELSKQTRKAAKKAAKAAKKAAKKERKEKKRKREDVMDI